jgi:hypothetical protein
VAFYVVMAISLVVVVTKLPTHVLPGGLAHEIDDESEAFPIVLVFCAYVQFVRRPQLAAGRSLWPWAVAIAVLSWVIAWLMLHVSMSQSLVTLNESFVAIGVMVLYACLPRPIPWSPVITVVAIVLLVVLHSNSFVITQAESLVPIALLPISFDWADRTILDARAEDTPVRRAVWCVLLLLVPLVSRAHVDLGSAHDVLHYPRRATEGFVALFVIHVYFSYILGARWRDDTSAATLVGTAAD